MEFISLFLYSKSIALFIAVLIVNCFIAGEIQLQSNVCWKSKTEIVTTGVKVIIFKRSTFSLSEPMTLTDELNDVFDVKLLFFRWLLLPKVIINMYLLFVFEKKVISSKFQFLKSFLITNAIHSAKIRCQYYNYSETFSNWYLRMWNVDVHETIERNFCNGQVYS